MAARLKVRDETTAGQSSAEYVLELLTERLTIRELIRSRVYQEVQDYNVRRPEHFQGLVHPSDSEQLLNGCKDRKPRAIDWHRQFDVAVKAFEAQHVIILIDDHQAKDLDEEIVIQPETKVTFLKLVPLMGG
jgi:hypothetical protein